MVFKHRHFKHLGCSSKVINTLLASCRGSTSWFFSFWCTEAQISPKQASISKVLSFLQDGLDKGLNLSLLRVQAFALGAIKGETEVFPLVLILIPPFRALVPQWDMKFFLNALFRPCFEPF
uniref:Uncharacterized protein n=1 Tax=Latimeria chalumnae TaxID=7897 RepID=H3AI46_LATCH